MPGWIESGFAVDIVLAVMALEFALLVIWPGRMTRAAAAADAIFTLAPGACLVLALRAALTGAAWPFIALWLAAAFPLHLWDVWRRRR